MLRNSNRKTTPKVKNGQVQKKNNHGWTEFEGLLDKEHFSFIKLKAEEGFTHVTERKAALDFVQLIPNWNIISKGLTAIVLDGEGSSTQAGKCYSPNCYHSIWLPAFPKDMTLHWSKPFAKHHEVVVNMLGVEMHESEPGCFVTEWNRKQAQAWQLLHLFLYGLYCHQECMKQGKDNYHHKYELAEIYANTTANIMLSNYEKLIERFY